MFEFTLAIRQHFHEIKYTLEVLDSALLTN